MPWNLSRRNAKPKIISITPILGPTNSLVVIDQIIQESQLILQRQARDLLCLQTATAFPIQRENVHGFLAARQSWAAGGEGGAAPGDVVVDGDVDLVDHFAVVLGAEADAAAGTHRLLRGIAAV